MAIRYEGMDIIHEYKGCEIKKVVKYYSQGIERYYVFDQMHFERLKDAKRHIDLIGER